jgi:hypothetical protein
LLSVNLLGWDLCLPMVYVEREVSSDGIWDATESGNERFRTETAS